MHDEQRQNHSPIIKGRAELLSDRALYDVARNNELIFKLIKEGVDANQIDHSIGNASRELNDVVRDNDLRLIFKLIKEGADVNQIDPRTGNTPLHTACLWGELDTVNLLLVMGAKASVNVKNIVGCTPLHLACSRGKKDLKISEALIAVRADVNNVDQDGYSPLHIAFSSGNRALVKLLFAARANFNVRNNEGKLPFESGSLSPEKEEKMILSLKRDLNPDYIRGARFRFTPLHDAIRDGDVDKVKLFLDAGANPDDFDQNGNTALHIAAKRLEVGIVKILLEHNASNQNNFANQKPMDVSNDKEINKILKDHEEAKEVNRLKAILNALELGYRDENINLISEKTYYDFKNINDDHRNFFLRSIKDNPIQDKLINTHSSEEGFRDKESKRVEELATKDIKR